MPVEQNNGLAYSLETVVCVRQDGQLVAIELQNGHITRYMTKEASRQDSLHLFGLDKVQ